MQILDVVGRVRFADEKMQKVGLVETDRLYFDLYCLKPGQSQKVHRHVGSDKIYYVLSGRASVSVGEEEGELTPGQAVLAPSGYSTSTSLSSSETGL